MKKCHRLHNRSMSRTAGMSQEQYRDICALWILCAMQRIRLPRRKLADLYDDSAFAYLVGLEQNDGDPDSSLDKDNEISLGRTSHVVRQRWMGSRRTQLTAQYPGLEGTALGENLTLLENKFGLTPAESEVLGIIILHQGYSPFSSTVDSLLEMIPTQDPMMLLAAMTGQDERGLFQSLSREGALAQTGLLQVSHNMQNFLYAFDLPNEFVSIMLAPHKDERKLLGHFYSEASPAKLTESDVTHLDADFRLLLDYFAAAIRGCESGSNVLLYGQPGVGKSEFARLLAKRVSARLFEVAQEDENGDPGSSQERLASYQLCQRSLGKKEACLVLFEEIEDIFPEDSWGSLGMIGGRGPRPFAGKAWINRVLDSNPVPAIWISNQIQQIDPAYLRRFDYILEIPKPPVAARRRIAGKYFEETPVSAEWIERMANWPDLTPAQLESAARIIRLNNPETSSEAEATAERVLRNTARVLGQKPSPANNTHARFNPDYINTQIAIDPLIVGLRRRPCANLCFYGPPGTGKTALARHIATNIDRNVMVRRASDLLSKWVGGSERNIADMFQQARDEQAVLVLDEADGLLADRREARAGWEVTQVNEILTHMEDFEGVFICTTNLFERLDQAAFRRFSFKLRFDFLKPEQRERMFLDAWQRLNPEAEILPEIVKRKLERLDKLTPGDYAAAFRQLSVIGDAPDADALTSVLEGECGVKGGLKRTIGFMP